MHCLHVLRDSPIGRDAAQASLPSMKMAIDEPGKCDHPGCVDDLYVGCLNAVCDRRNTVTFDKDVSPDKITDAGIHADNMARSNQNATHRTSPSTFVVTLRALVRLSPRAPPRPSSLRAAKLPPLRESVHVPLDPQQSPDAWT